MIRGFLTSPELLKIYAPKMDPDQIGVGDITAEVQTTFNWQQMLWLLWGLLAFGKLYGLRINMSSGAWEGNSPLTTAVTRVAPLTRRKL